MDPALRGSPRCHCTTPAAHRFPTARSPESAPRRWRRSTPRQTDSRVAHEDVADLGPIDASRQLVTYKGSSQNPAHDLQSLVGVGRVEELQVWLCRFSQDRFSVTRRLKSPLAVVGT